MNFGILFQRSRLLGMQVIFCLLLGGSVSVAHAEVGPRGGPGDVPTPFISNEKVELADGENYTLIGKFIVRDGNLWFQVDLDAHPWLANQKRKEFPFYRVIGTRVDLEPVVVRADRVQAVVKAEGSIIERDLRPSFRIGLEVLESPTVPTMPAMTPGGSAGCPAPSVGSQNPISDSPGAPVRSH